MDIRKDGRGRVRCVFVVENNLFPVADLASNLIMLILLDESILCITVIYNAEINNGVLC